MKKLLILVIALLSVFALTGCKKTPKEEKFQVIFYTYPNDVQTRIPTLKDVKKGSTITEPTIVPKKIGEKFLGWYTSFEYTKQWNFSVDTVTQNIVLYAKWQKRVIQVKFELKGGTLSPGETLPTTFTSGEVINLPFAIKEGYDHEWNYFENPTITQLKIEKLSNELFKIIGEEDTEITIYSVWKAKKITIFFDLNPYKPGMVTPPSRNILYDEVFQNLPVLEDTETHIFKGWNTKKDGNGIDVTEGMVNKFTSNTKLYAKWEIK